MKREPWTEREPGGMGIEAIPLPKVVKARARIIAGALLKAGATIYQLTGQGDWKKADHGQAGTRAIYQRAIVSYLDFLTSTDIDGWVSDMLAYRESCFSDGDNLYPSGKAKCPICHNDGDSALIAQNYLKIVDYVRSVTQTGTIEEEVPGPPTPPPHTRQQR